MKHWIWATEKTAIFIRLAKKKISSIGRESFIYFSLVVISYYNNLIINYRLYKNL